MRVHARRRKQQANVALADLEHSSVRELALQLGDRHSAHGLDATDPPSVEQAITAVIERHGRIDAAILAQGVLRNEPFLDISIDAWDGLLQSTHRGVYSLSARR